MGKQKKTVKVVLIEPDGHNGWKKITTQEDGIFFMGPDKWAKVDGMLVESASFDFSFTEVKGKKYVSFVNKPGEATKGRGSYGGGTYGGGTSGGGRPGGRDYDKERTNATVLEERKQAGMIVLNASDKATQITCALIASGKMVSGVMEAWQSSFEQILASMRDQLNGNKQEVVEPAQERERDEIPF